jgi:SAM-dependent methyltransferase
LNEPRPYASIVGFCERCLETYGDNYLGVGWTKSSESVDTRYKIMLEVIKQPASSAVSLLDFGCGASHLYEYIKRQQLDKIQYAGLDVSDKFLELSRRKYPDVTYYDTDILEVPDDIPMFDYIIMCGIFNGRFDLPFDTMTTYFEAVVSAVFKKARHGIAFNVMSKQVDWEREDLFHLPFDMLASFLAKRISRHFVIRHDYGLYEYTVYAYREAQSQ